MKKTSIILVAFIFSTFSFAKSEGIPKYYGAKSTEAELSFKSRININFSKKLSLSDLKEGPKKDLVMQAIALQIPHLIGHFSSESFKNKFNYPGVLGEEWDVKFTKIQTNGKRKTVSYDFKGMAVFHSDSFGNKKTISVPIRLPEAMDLVYDLGVVDGVNLCTDEHYNSEGDFFYFWDPELKDCPLKGNKKDIVRVSGKLKRKDNTKKTYPEYDVLYKENKKLKMGIFLGYLDDEISLSSVNTSDSSFEALNEIKGLLVKRGFKQTFKKYGFRRYKNGSLKKGTNVKYILTKDIKTHLGTTISLEVSLLLADTDVNSKDATFQHFYTESLEKDDLIVYDGHSGLGANLDLSYFPEFDFSKVKQYQLMYINGCSSYPYYNGKYFKAKKGGSKKLDIITSGLSTYSTTVTSNIMAFTDTFLEGRIDSYQTILDEIEDSNGAEESYLTGINGDEDNTYRP